jgi:hypothetical protein
MLSDTDFVILNAIYLKKMAAADTIADVTALPPQAVSECLAAAAQAGWILAMPGGAMLLDGGIEEVLATYRDAYAGVRADPAVVTWYEHFETINARFIALVSEWQQTEGDERVERRLLQTAERLTRNIGQLLPQIPRYGNYVRRLQRSMDLVDQGQRDHVCKPTIDSVHNIWFEFHEDILAVLGRPRDTT